MAFLFPGQGAQSVGMAQELCAETPAAAELFARASAILGYDLLDVCTNGVQRRLQLRVGLRRLLPVGTGGVALQAQRPHPTV